MESGTIIKINPKGFGFISRGSDKPNMFFHFSNLMDLPFDEQLLERRVRFDIGFQRDGREHAINIESED